MTVTTQFGTATLTPDAVAPGDIRPFPLDVADGTYNITITQSGYEGSGTVTVVGNVGNATINLRQTPPFPWGVFIAFGLVATAVVVFYWRR